MSNGDQNQTADAEIVAMVRRAVQTLNAVADAASDAGIRVRFGVMRESHRGCRVGMLRIERPSDWLGDVLEEDVLYREELREPNDRT